MPPISGYPASVTHVRNHDNSKTTKQNTKEFLLRTTPGLIYPENVLTLGEMFFMMIRIHLVLPNSAWTSMGLANIKTDRSRKTKGEGRKLF